MPKAFRIMPINGYILFLLFIKSNSHVLYIYLIIYSAYFVFAAGNLLISRHHCLSAGLSNRQNHSN